MVATRKYSQFPLAGAFQPGDVFVGLQNGVNVRFNSISGAGGGAVEQTITQDTSGLAVGDWVRFDTGSGIYVPAQANNAVNANVVGLVKSIADDALTFVLQQVGYNTVSFGSGTPFGTLTPGDYFLSTTNPGGMSTSAPMNDDEVSVPVFAADSSSTGFVRNFRGKILGDDGSGSGGGTGTSVFTVPGTVAGANVGDAVYSTGSNTFALADNSDETTAEVVGVIIAIDVAAPSFTIQTEGYSTVFGTSPLNPLTPASVYWLQSGGTSPNLSTTRPTSTTAYRRPVMIGITTSSATILQRWPLQDPDGVGIIKINQPSHMLSVGNFVRPSTTNNGQWVKAQADSIANATGVWMVIRVMGDDFWIQQDGITDKITVVGTPAIGATAYLDQSTAGVATYTEPPGTGEVSLPLFRLTDNSTTPHTGELLNVRPMLQPGANGGGGGGKVLLKQIDATAMSQATFDFSTVFSDFPTYKRYRLEWDDMYNDDAILGGYVVKVEVYIGGVLQTTGYTISEGTFVSNLSAVFTPQSSVTYIPLTGEPTTGGCYNSLTLAHSGLLDFLSPLTNGSSKVMRGRFDGYGNINTARLTGNIRGCMIGSTSPLDGFRISLVSGGSTELFGCFSVYGISE